MGTCCAARYIRLMVDGDGHLSTMIHQIGRLNDTVAEQNLLPVLLSLPILSWEAVSQITREELQRLIDLQFNLVTSLPENCAQFSVKTCGIQVVA